MKNSLSNLSQELFEQRFVQLQGLLSLETCQLLSKRIHILQSAGRLKDCDFCPPSQWIYGDACFDEVHKLLSEQLSQLLGIELKPSFNSVRLYSNGATLPKHIDRDACEFSLSIPIDYAGDEVWPIYLAQTEQDQRGQAIFLETGDALVLQGTKVYHWRKPLKNQWQIQAFFFFVDAVGEYRDHTGDVIDKYPQEK